MTSGQKELENHYAAKAFEIEDYSTCYHCKTPGLSKEDIYCPNCRFPQHGTPKEQYAFFGQQNRKREFIKSQQKEVQKATTILYILAGLNVVISIFAYSTLGPALSIINFGLAGAYLGLAIWSRKKPFQAIVIGFFLYISLIAINAIFDPITIISGLIWKIIIISAFVYGYRAAKEVEKYEKMIQKHS